MDCIGRYRIVRELGRGAMGVVYLATDPTIGRSVAIKTIRLTDVDNLKERERLKERLFREARSAGALSHPGIVTIYDMEEQGDLAYIAMEYVNGPTLDQLMSETEPISRERMFSILGQNAAALDYAHQKGVVHRDIKPANIMLDQEGVAKITDFGIAKLTASEQFTLTGAILGTPHYMSPEQVQGHAVDGRSDQFSLAVIAYEVLTGEKPFTGEQLSTVVYRIVAEEPLPAHRLNPSLGAPIETVLKKAMAKKPDARYANCRQFIDALESACGTAKGWKTMPRGASLSQPTAAVPPPAPAPAPTAPRRARRSDTTAIRERRHSNVMPFLLAILVAGGLVGVIAWQTTPWITDSGQKQETPAAPNPNQPTAAAGTSDKPSALGNAPAQPQAAARATAPSGTQPAANEPPATQAAAQTPANPPQSEAAKPDAPAPQAAVPPAQPEPEAAAPAREHVPAVARPPKPVGVWVQTSPAGARATLDGRPDASCATPCSLSVLPGRHSVVVSLAGHQTEYREIDVGRDPQEMPLIALRPFGGVLLLSTVPQGAAVSVNGRPWPNPTPAQLNLPPGSYVITVEKDGKRISQPVTVKQGGTQMLRIPLE